MKTLICLAFFWIMIAFKAPAQCIMFYNVENLFDCVNDSLTLDEEFLPTGIKHWTYTRLYHKFSQLSKVILVAGDWDPPAIVGLCEVENGKVLQQLISYGALAPLQYQKVHFDSPDRRGIDVALIYRSSHFRVLESSLIPVALDNAPTRDILYVQGILQAGDTLHLFVNHWPSRRGGLAVSNPKRMLASNTLLNEVQALLQAGKQVLVMGDFNDGPFDESLQNLSLHSTLMNCMQHALPGSSGSHCYQGHWDYLDQFLISPALVSRLKRVEVVKKPFLMKMTPQGLRPRSTYYGYKYEGGFSDHLPILLELN